MSNLVKVRRAFIDTCLPQTQRIHIPIIDIDSVGGFLNPLGLGQADDFSFDFIAARVYGWGQTTVASDTVQGLHDAEAAGTEYGIVSSPATRAVCEKFNGLYGGAGAILLPSGMSAIATALTTFDTGVVLIPENCYFPTRRAMDEHLSLDYEYYPSNASGAQLEGLIERIEQDGRDVSLVYMESPGSHTFEIPSISKIVEVAKKYGKPTVMDNAWATHVGFNPLKHGVDVVLLAATKYEGGYGDTPSGFLISATKELHAKVSRASRVLGTGAVDPGRCGRLFHRVDSTGERMKGQHESALEVIQWLEKQDFVAEIIAPYLESSPDYERWTTYFNAANSLFTVVFDERYDQADINRFLDASPLTLTGESWGGHVTLTLPVDPKRELTSLRAGQKVRFAVGMEDPGDVVQSLEKAVPQLG